MKDTLTPPRFGLSPDQFDPRHFDDFQRRLTLFLLEMISTGHCDIGTLRFINLPTSASGLSKGTVWVDINDNCTLKMVCEVVFEDDPPVTGFSVTGSVGTVTVTDEFETLDWFEPFSTPYFLPPTYIPPASNPVNPGFLDDVLQSVTGQSVTGSVGTVTVQPIEILLSSLGNTSGGTQATKTFSSLAVGSGAGRTIILMAGIADNSGTTSTITNVTVDGNSCTEIVSQGRAVGAGSIDCAIWVRDLTSEDGNVDVAVTASETVGSHSMSFIVVTGMKSTTATDTAAGSVGSGAVATSTTLDGPSGGIVVGCATHDDKDGSLAWGSSMTERSDVGTPGGTGEHRHGAAYDLLVVVRSASTETVTSSQSSGFVLSTATFR